MNRMDIYRRRHTLRQQPQRDHLFRVQQATYADSLGFLAHQLTATHVWDVQFSVTSTASRISMAAWVFSALLWWRLCSFTQQ